MSMSERDHISPAALAICGAARRSGRPRMAHNAADGEKQWMKRRAASEGRQEGSGGMWRTARCEWLASVLVKQDHRPCHTEVWLASAVTTWRRRLVAPANLDGPRQA